MNYFRKILISFIILILLSQYQLFAIYIDETTAYQYAMNINYNEEGIPYKGSAIFLHCYTKNPYTAGCVALPYSYMETVLKNVSKNARIIIDLKENIYNY